MCAVRGREFSLRPLAFGCVTLLRRPNRSTIKWAAFATSLVLLTACSDPSGPIAQRRDDLRAVCIGVDEDRTATVGFPALVNTGQQPVVIDSVNLMEPTDLLIIEPWIMTHREWPEDQPAPDFSQFPGYIAEIDPEWWSSRSGPAAGAEIPPANATDEAFVLVLGLQMDPDTNLATASGVEVEYTVDGGQSAYRMKTSIELDRHSQDPPGMCR